MSRERYLLQRDEAQSRRDIRESEERAARSRGGINLSRGIGRGLGTLLGIALAPATGGASMALAGGLGSLGGSFLGGAYGKHKYGGPEKADVGLFNRDIAREQRKGVDQYWKGVKEQTITNALQDAVTAGMYGAKIKSGMADAASSLGFDKTAIKLGGYPKGMGVPTAPTPIQQVDPSGLVPDYQQQQVGQYLDQIKQSNIARADSFGKGIGTTTSGSFAGDAGAGVGKGVAGGGGGGSAGQGMNNWITNLGKNPNEFENLVDTAPRITPPSPSGYDVVGNPLGAVGSGPMPSPNFLGDAVNNANLAPDIKMQQRILDYMNKGWARDHTINKDMWDQIAGAQNIQIPNLLGVN